jgi:hypothetical protein
LDGVDGLGKHDNDCGDPVLSKVCAFLLVDVRTATLNLAAVRSCQEDGPSKACHIRFLYNLLLGLGLFIRLDAAHCEAHALALRVDSRLLDYIVGFLDRLGQG